MTNAEVMTALRVAWEYAHLHDSWVTPLEEALDGAETEEALWQILPDSPSIWQIVLHMAKWNENIVDRVERRDTSNPNEDAHWPEIAVQPSPAEWREAQARLQRSISAVDTLLQTATLEKVQASEYGLADLLCRLTHMGYHIGQITKIREAYRAR